MESNIEIKNRIEKPRVRRKINRKTFKKISTLLKLKKENKINDQFILMLNRISYEDLIALKLEVSTNWSRSGNIYGLPLWKGLIEATKEALVKIVLKETSSFTEASMLLGIHQMSLRHVCLKYGITLDEIEKKDEKFI